MQELAPTHPGLRYGQWVEVLRDRERQIALLQCQQRLELAMFITEQFGDPSARFAKDAFALLSDRSPRQAQNRIDTAVAFAACPAVVARVADGSWLIEHADAVLDGLACATLSHAQQQQALELLLSRRLARTPWELRRAALAAVAVLFPDLVAEQAQRAQADRDVQSWQHRLGEGALTATGPAERVEAMMTALETMTWPPAPEDTRTAAQRRFDCLYDLITGAAEPGQWQVHVLVGLQTLLGEDNQPAETARGTLLPAPVARELATRATLRRVIVDDSGRLVSVDAHTHRPDQREPSLPVPAAAPTAAEATAPTGPAATAPVPVGLRSAVPEAWSATEENEADPDEPSTADREWWREQLAAREPESGKLDTLHLHEETTSAPVPAPRQGESWWTPEALDQALQQMTSSPVDEINLSAAGYQVPRRLKRHLALRDRRCRFPGCPRPAEQCDADHLLPWPRGSTTATNLASECEHHHQAKHHYLSVQQLPDGTLRWTLPSGHHYDSPVPTLLESAAYTTLTDPSP